MISSPFLLHSYTMRRINEVSLSVFVRVLQIPTSIYLLTREWISREAEVVLSMALQAKMALTR